MTRRLAWIVLVLLFTPSAEAGWFGGLFKRKGGGGGSAPKPVDYVQNVRTKSDHSHKVGRRGSHPGKYARPEWGNQWERLFRSSQRPGAHYLYRR
ncbi:MAG: hypothetical protein HY317_02965 [Acidobacteria bacterium]|nr:hypothetical protein [Acidobacteriota bacterium]